MRDEKMYSVMIVEDETYVRNSLKKLIDWKGLGCSVVCDAEDGEHALELLLSNSIDIVITDIKMDNTDGITLAQQIKEKDPDIQIIFITGYADFEYAKSAIKLDIRDFILKPTDPEELREAVLRAISEIESKRTKERRIEKLQQIINKNIPVLRERFLFELAYGRFPSEPALKERLRFLSMRLHDYYVVLFEIDKYREFIAAHDEQYRQVVRFGMRETSALLSDSGEPFYFLELDANLFMFVISGLEVMSKIEAFRDGVTELFGISLSFGLSERTADVTRFRSAVSQAGEALRYKFYTGIGSIVPYRDVTDGAVPAKQCIVDSAPLVEQVTAGNTNKVKTELVILFNALKSCKGGSVEYVKNVASEIVILLERYLFTNDYSFSIGPQGHELLNEIANSKTFNALERLLVQYVVTITEAIQENHRQKNSSLVRTITEFISRNYHKAIKLDDLANVVYKHPKYLSRLIKQETGSNFSDILLKVRMEKAKELLMKNELNISEVAYKVGINDPHYFSKIFKKYYDMTPTEYRLGVPLTN